MRRILVTLVILAACKSGDSSTGPAPVASVAISAPSSVIGVGQTTMLSASGIDASGKALVGLTVTWNTSAPGVATVANGLVTGVSAGSATITATISDKSAQTVITVTGGATGCTGVTPLSVAVGEIHTLSATERQQLCLSAGASAGEYVLIPFNNGLTAANGAAAASIPVSFAATNTSATSGAPALAAGASAAANATLSPIETFEASNIGAAFEARLRAIERAELTPLMRGRRARVSPQLLRRDPNSRSNITNLPANPAVGTPISLNTNGTNGCSNAQMHGARVAAVSNTAIVVVDSGAPAGGFTDAEFLSFAVTFDTLIFPLDTTAYGKPFDMDNNGRVILFFTQAVNQLTPASTPATSGFIGGFFFARDLFPKVANAVVNFGCAGSNEGEMFYLPVPDPNSQFNTFFKTKATVQSSTYGTLAHEFQHLINASRRIYVTVANVDFMETWLNEAMSHVAEELLYYRVSGLTPRSDLTLQTVTGSPAQLSAINTYQIDNLSRLSTYLKAPDLNSPYNPTDQLATRGASWQLLRYALDLSPGTGYANLHAMIDSPVSVTNPTGGSEVNGASIFTAIFGGVFTGSLTTAVRQELITQFFDNSGIAIAAQYAFPSWNFRSVLTGLKSNNNAYPLATTQLLGSAPVAFTLTAGGGGYARFHVNASTVAGIVATSGGGALPTALELILIRTQ